MKAATNQNRVRGALNRDVSNIPVNVVRDGENIAVSKYELVVGDIVRLSVGDIMEGDGVLVEGFDVETDESALTGEPVLIKKSVQYCHGELCRRESVTIGLRSRDDGTGSYWTTRTLPNLSFGLRRG